MALQSAGLQVWRGARLLANQSPWPAAVGPVRRCLRARRPAVAAPPGVDLYVKRDICGPMTCHTGRSSQMHATWHQSPCPCNQCGLPGTFQPTFMLPLADCHAMTAAPRICRAGRLPGRHGDGARHAVRWPGGRGGPAAAAPQPHPERRQAQREPVIDSHPICPCEPQCAD